MPQFKQYLNYDGSAVLHYLAFGTSDVDWTYLFSAKDNPGTTRLDFVERCRKFLIRKGCEDLT